MKFSVALRTSSALLGALAVAVASARAHFVWIERTGTGAAAFFGEYASGLRETQAGYLKNIVDAKLLLENGRTEPVGVGADSIALTNPLSGDVRLSAFYRFEKGDTLVQYGARFGRSTPTHGLDLELVPAAPDRNNFVVLFRGAPIPQTEVTLFSQEGWSRTFRSDDKGRVSILTPWPGQYVLEVAQVEERSGEYAGRAHAKVRHVSTLTFEHRL